MTRPEKLLAFTLLLLITALCVVLVLQRPVPCEIQEKSDPIKEYDPVGRTSAQRQRLNELYILAGTNPWA